MKQKIFLTCLLVGGMLSTKAQHTINTAGHSTQINGMTFSYSIGEMVLTSTERNSQLIITQGVLQPGTKSSSSTEQINSGWLDQASTSIKVYPNPTQAIIFAEYMSEIAGTGMLQLFDAVGKVVWSSPTEQKVGLNKHSIDMRSYASGSYYLMLQTANEQHYSFKIQKID